MGEKPGGADMSDVKRIRDSTVTAYAKRLERDCCRKYGRSYAFSTLCYAASEYIVEVESDSGYVLMRDGWREAIRQKAERYISATS